MGKEGAAEKMGQGPGPVNQWMRLDSFRKVKKHLKWEKRVFKTHLQSLFGFLTGSTSVS